MSNQQKRSCDVCHLWGEVGIPPHSGVMELVYAIEEAHREVSPKCGNTVRGIRIHTAEDEDETR